MQLRSILLPQASASLSSWIDSGFNAVHVTVDPDCLPGLAPLLELASLKSFPVHAHLRLGAPADPSLLSLNCHGEIGAPCPSQPQVQSNFLTLFESVDKLYPWTSILLEDLAFQGFHSDNFYNNICFCPACIYGLGAVGDLLKQIALESPTGRDHPSVGTLLLWRRSVQYGLLRQLKEISRAPLSLLTAASIRYTGSSSVLTFEEAHGLAASCCVYRDDLARLKRLPRPLPVYAIIKPSQERDLDEFFSGMILVQ